MLDLHQMQRAFAHDPMKVADREPGGAVPAGTDVVILLHTTPEVREFVRVAWLEVASSEGLFDDPVEDEDGAEAVEAIEGSMGADGFAERDAWMRLPMQPCEQGYSATIRTTGEPRILFYRFRIRTSLGDILCARRSDGTSTAGVSMSIGLEVPYEQMPQAFQLTVYDPEFIVPTWFSGSVMYQVFPDRFAIGPSGVRHSGVRSHMERGWPVRVHENWDEAPDWGDAYDPVDFFGGTLEGIEEHLDYLVSLGVQVLYLNPVCEARSNHRYNTGDYDEVDPILGDWESFEKLALAARARGISIVLDTVLSHTGSASRYFNADNSYDSVGAAQSADSPYRPWYWFSDEYPTGYRCWWGDDTLPEVDEQNSSWQEYTLGTAYLPGASEDPESERNRGVLGRWMGYGARGIRLDVADEIPDDVLEHIRSSVKNTLSDTAIIGEVWEDPTTKVSYGSQRTYALGRALDSVMNYPLRAALLQYVLGGTDASQLATFLKLQRCNYPKPMYMSLMNLLSSHDVERVRSVLAHGQEFRGLPRGDQANITANISEEADARGACLQRILATLIYALPGVPCLYYGDEKGMHGGRDPFDRATFPWSGKRYDCGEDLTSFYKELGKLRNGSDVLHHGDVAFYSFGKDVVCILRTPLQNEGETDALLYVANRSNSSVRFIVDLVDEASGLSDNDVARIRQAKPDPACVFTTVGSSNDVVNATCEDGIFSTTIGPMRARIYQLNCGLNEPLQRGLGVICHITSIPNVDENGKPVPGTLGAPAKRFVDDLARSGVKYWQILPLNPADEYGSPYAGLSAFAGNTHLLEGGENTVVHITPTNPDYQAFLTENREWLLPYATFMAIKKTVGEIPWQNWPAKYRHWKPGMEKLPELAAYVQAECARQFEFERQWRELRDYANERGVQIIGDMPIYVSADSADVWANRKYFALDENGEVDGQGGVPPDQFAENGQLWGNPTYRWDILRARGYDWWIKRFKRMFGWYDYVRLDHFVGFNAYYSIPAGKSAFEGEWKPGPGLELFRTAFEKLGSLPVIAEDLGIITPEVRQLLAQTGFPGMDVVLFADGDPRYDWSAVPGKVCFTSTHDTQTLVGWALDRYCGNAENGEDGLDKAREIASGLVKKAAASSARVVMVPLQDVLELDDSARMNVPGTAGNNWKWQAPAKDLHDHLPYLAELAALRRSSK